MEKIRVALVGAGERASIAVYPAFKDQPDVELVGVCDIDEQRARAAAESFGIPACYGQGGVYDYQRMLAELRPDAVAIIGQPHIMYDLWAYALQNGYHLYIEKPMALTAHQARSLHWMAQQRGLVTQVSFQRRYTPMVRMLHGECLRRGPVVHAICRFYKSANEPHLAARDHMMDDCVHSIDTLRWACGGEIVKIESTCRRVGVPDINYISAALHFDNGAMGYLVNSWSSGKRIFDLEVHSPGVYFHAEHEGKGRLFADGDVEGVEYDTAQVAGSGAFHVFTGVGEAVRDFVQCVKTGRQPEACFQSSVKTMEAAEAILARALLAGE